MILRYLNKGLIAFVLVLSMTFGASSVFAQEGDPEVPEKGYIGAAEADEIYGENYIRASDAVHRALGNEDNPENQAQEFREAARLYGEAYQDNPNTLDALLNRGASYAQVGEHNKAIEDATAYLELRPNDITALRNRASSYMSVGDYQSAYRDFQRALELADSTQFAEASPYRYQQIRESLDQAKKRLVNNTNDDSLLVEQHRQARHVTSDRQHNISSPASPDIWVWADWYVSRKLHNVDRNGVTFRNQPDWACGLWNPGATNIENAGWFFCKRSGCR